MFGQLSSEENVVVETIGMWTKGYDRREGDSKGLLYAGLRSCEGQGSTVQTRLPVSHFQRLSQELEGNLARKRNASPTPFPLTSKALLRVESCSHPALPALNAHFWLEKHGE